VSKELEELQRLLERATAAADASENDSDPEAASLREGWIAFGRLLEATQAPVEMSIDSRPVLPPKRPYGRFWPAAGLLAASLLVCAVAMWRLQTASRTENASPSLAQTASTTVARATPATVAHSAPVKKEQKPVASADEPQWDDSFDEQVAQVGQQMTDVQQNAYAWTDTSGAVQSKIEQIQKDFNDNGL
jgi:hypothetical protein